MVKLLKKENLNVREPEYLSLRSIPGRCITSLLPTKYEPGLKEVCIYFIYITELVNYYRPRMTNERSDLSSKRAPHRDKAATLR
jgi:hypothetical protein